MNTVNRRTFLKQLASAALVAPLAFLKEKVCDCVKTVSVLIPGERGNVCHNCATAAEVNSFLFTRGLRSTP